MLDTSVPPPSGGGKKSFCGIRSSKFKHVYGAPAKKNKCYDNIKITRNAGDSSFCAVNPKFLAVVVEVGGGGSFVVLPLGTELLSDINFWIKIRVRCSSDAKPIPKDTNPDFFFPHKICCLLWSAENGFSFEKEMNKKSQF